MKIKSFFLLFLLLLVLSSCSQTNTNVVMNSGSNLTLGKVQKEIRIGMTQAEVAEALGSPNIITTDAEGNETWIYDKIATSVQETHKKGGIFLVLVSASSSSSTYDQSQKTMTVIIKFDKNKRVKSFKYHVTKF